MKKSKSWPFLAHLTHKCLEVGYYCMLGHFIKDHLIYLEVLPITKRDLLQHFSVNLLHWKKLDLGLGDPKHFRNRFLALAIS